MSTDKTAGCGGSAPGYNRDSGLRTMNAWLICADSLAAVVAGVRLVLGHGDPVRPVLGLITPRGTEAHPACGLAPRERRPCPGRHRAVLPGDGPPVGSGLAAGILAAHFVAYAPVFLVLALQLDRPRGGLALPQWLLPVAVLSAIGATWLPLT